jgi:FixJ family two-component response regulator
VTKHDHSAEAVVIIVDDDRSMRDALQRLLRSAGLKVEAHASADAFLEAELPANPCCLILDVRMPGLSGLELQEELLKEDVHIPIIFVTGHADVPTTIRALKGGAVDFLTKPFREQDLLGAVLPALDLAKVQREREQKLSNLNARFNTLTQRKREIMQLVAEGLMNKQVSHKLGISEVTVKIHRGNVMRKMQAGSLADLVRMSDRLDPRT